MKSHTVGIVAIGARETLVPFVALQARDSILKQPKKIARESLTDPARIIRQANIEPAGQGPNYFAVLLRLDYFTKKLKREILNLAGQSLALRRASRTRTARIVARRSAATIERIRVLFGFTAI
jgi:hypothetical protein